MAQVLVKQFNLYGANNRLVKAEVVSSTGDTIRVKLNQKVMDVKRSETVALPGPGSTQLMQSRTPARNGFASGFFGRR